MYNGVGLILEGWLYDSLGVTETSSAVLLAALILRRIRGLSFVTIV